MFAGTVTDFEVGRISRQDDVANGQNLSNAKRRYLWEFLSQRLGKDICALEEAEIFVSQKLGWNSKLTKSDFDGLIDTIKKYSYLPRIKISRSFIKKGQQIGLRNID